MKMSLYNTYVHFFTDAQANVMEDHEQAEAVLKARHFNQDIISNQC